MKVRTLLLVTTLVPLSLWLVLDETILNPEYLRTLNAPLSILKKSAASSVDKTTSDGAVSATTTTSPDDNDYKKKKDAPLFVFHIGPPKTGTSTIQGYARENRKVLKSDNFYYLGHDTTRDDARLHELSKFCRKCDIRDCSQCSRRWKEFERAVNEQFQKNHNVFISDETFNRFFNDGEMKEHQQLWIRLMPLLRRWRVRIIFSYRRYYEWIPSTYFQSYHPVDESLRSQWPEDGGGVIPSFPDFLDSFVAANEMKQPSTIRKKWEEQFLSDNVWIFNMHNNDGNFVRHFYCEMLPEATHVCDHLTSQPSSITNNPSSSKHVHYDMLAVAAHRQGLVNSTLSRTEVAKAVENYSKDLGLQRVTDFASQCLTKKQSGKFLNMSLQLESDMVPEFHSSPKGAVDHKERYNEALEAGKFCSIKPDVVLQEKKWQSFFQNLGPDTKQKVKQPGSKPKGTAKKNSNSIELTKEKKPNEISIALANDASKVTKKPEQKSAVGRRTPMLCLYTGDEGSTVLSEALRLHPQVYSPDWKIEPANAGSLVKRGGTYSLDAQIDAIRFLLQMSSNMTVYPYRKNPMSLAAYDARMNDTAKATYLKAAVCRKEHNSMDKWSPCIEKVLSNLLCGPPGDTVQHLILPVRHGFDRICSVFVHRDKSMYQKFSQFGGAGKSVSNSSLVSMSEQKATELRKKMQQYISNFMEVVRLAQESCPRQEHKVKIHVFDYDAAKQVGIEKALTQLFVDLGLRHSGSDLDLGRFGQRKPGHYCETIFDSKSRELLRQNEAAYKEWLKSTCSDSPSQVWCKEQ